MISNPSSINKTSNPYLLQIIEDKKKTTTMFQVDFNRINGVMVSVLASSVVDRGFRAIKIIKFVASPLSRQH
jgi:hypothetical protein